MVKIGVFACGNTNEIAEALILILKTSENTVAVKNNYTAEEDIPDFLFSDTDFLIIPIRPDIMPKFRIDILILDNPQNEKIVTYDLISCIGDDTILIYNTDNGYLPKLEHPNAIDYGFSAKSTVGISSVEYFGSNTCSFIVSIQEPIKCLYGEFFPIGEILITGNSDIKLENRIPAVICSLVCSDSYKNPIKI